MPVHACCSRISSLNERWSTSLRIGVGASARFLSKQGGLATRLVSGYRPDHLVDALQPYVEDRDNAIAGFHVNTFNQVQAAVDWLRSTADEAADLGVIATGYVGRE